METFLYRREATARDLAAAAGAGVAAGVVVAYLAQLFLRRERRPVAPPESPRVRRPSGGPLR